MKRPALDAEREAIYARMRDGERFTLLDVWRSTKIGTKSWAFDTLKIPHRQGLTHIASWRRSPSGPMSPVYRWGAGKDAPKPKPLTDAQKCKRYRKKMKTEDPDRYAAMTRKHRYHRRKTPLMDPLLALVTGYRRHGRNAWVKR